MDHNSCVLLAVFANFYPWRSSLPLHFARGQQQNRDRGEEGVATLVASPPSPECEIFQFLRRLRRSGRRQTHLVILNDVNFYCESNASQSYYLCFARLGVGVVATRALARRTVALPLNISLAPGSEHPLDRRAVVTGQTLPHFPIQITLVSVIHERVVVAEDDNVRRVGGYLLGVVDLAHFPVLLCGDVLEEDGVSQHLVQNRGWVPLCRRLDSLVDQLVNVVYALSEARCIFNEARAKRVKRVRRIEWVSFGVDVGGCSHFRSFARSLTFPVVAEMKRTGA